MSDFQFENLCMMTIKNPSNQCDKKTLLLIVKTLSDKLGFGFPTIYWFETGKQDQIHIHCIIKKKIDQSLIQKFSKTFKQTKTEIVEFSYDDMGDPVLLKNKLSHDSFTFHICPIESKSHFLEITEIYRFKEADYRCDFIDEVKPYTLSKSSLPFVK